MLNVPLVSIIMPTYNSEKYIVDSVSSVINQTYKNWELIIVNDCSRDSTKDILMSISELESRLIIINLYKNIGTALARNKGVELAKGTYIAFIDSDDIWEPIKLEYQIGFMLENKYAFTCTSYVKIDEKGNKTNNIVKARMITNYNQLLKNNPGNSTVIYNSQIIGKIYIPDIRKRNDYVMWLKLIKVAGVLYGIDKVLSNYRVRNDSLSSNKLSLISYHWEVYRKIEKLNIFMSIYLIVYWVVKKLIRN